MLVDVVMATRGGSKRLRSTVESIGAVDYPRDKFRIIVIDNNEAPEVAIALADVDAPLTVLHCAVPGKSNALNSAIDALRGDLIVFTDDDVAIDRDWLKALVRAAETQVDYDMFAGRSNAVWEREPPPGFAELVPMGSSYAVNEDPVSGPCDAGMMWGLNMAVRPNVLASTKFNPRVGPQPGSYPMGQDTEFARRAAQAGHRSYYVADAIVGHTIKAETISEDWVIARAERLGFGQFAASKMPIKRRTPLPYGWEIGARYLMTLAASPIVPLLPSPRRRFWERWRHSYNKGLLRGFKAFATD